MWDYGEDNRGPLMAEVSIAMAVMSVFAVALRSYTMARILKRFVIEDYLAVLTCLLQCGFCAVVVVGCSYGLGAHLDYVSVENRHKALQYKWAGMVAYIVVSTIVKFVVGIFLLRLCVNNNWQRITIIVLLCVVGLFNAFYVFLAIFQCQPVEFYWWRYTENAPVTGKCNGKALATIPTYFAVLIGLVSDLILALLPATLIKGARLDKKTKISVCCVLALGSLASVATIARVPYAKQLLSNPDYLYNFTDLAIWSIVECGIAITASSLATLRPLFIQMKLLANTHFTSRYAHSRFGSGGLPIQSANSVVISSHVRSMKYNKKRETAMTGSTAVSAGASSQLGMMKGMEEGRAGGIFVEKEFELSIISKEKSLDSIDRLEAEINEVITPGAAKRKSRFMSRRSSYGSQRPCPVQTEVSSQPRSAEHSVVSASPTWAGPRFVGGGGPSNPSSPQAPRPRRSSEGPPKETTTSSSSGTPSSASHPGTPHEGASPTPPGAALSPHTSFHLPTRLAHQRTQSNQSGISGFDSRGTWQSRATVYQGLSAPSRVPHQLDDKYASYGVESAPSPSAAGGPLSRRPSASATPPTRRPSDTPLQFPFPEVPEASGRGRERVSAFSSDADAALAWSLGGGGGEGLDEAQSARWTGSSPEEYSLPSPLRSHPSRTPGIGGNWL